MSEVTIPVLSTVIGVLIMFGVFFAKGWFIKTDRRLDAIGEKQDSTNTHIEDSIRRVHGRIDDLNKSVNQRVEKVEKDHLILKTECRARHGNQGLPDNRP